MEEIKGIFISGNDRFFVDGLKQLLQEREEEPMPEGLPEIQVFTGMTLSEAFFIAERSFDSPKIVFCSDPCRRMLEGTPGYETAVYLLPNMTVKMIQKVLTEWLGGYGHRANHSPAFKQKDRETVSVLLTGECVRLEAQRLGQHEKKLYSRMRTLSRRLGTVTRQELYLKVQLMLRELTLPPTQPGALLPSAD